MVIFVAHGSRNPQWRASVEALIESLRTELDGDGPRLAFMECSPPTLLDVVDDAVGQGATRISVVPLFLTSEGHVDRHVRPQVEQLRERHGQVDLELRPPVGEHQLFQDMLRKIAVQLSGQAPAARADERDERMVRQNSDCVREGA